MSGVVALVAGALGLLAFIVLFAVGFRAATRRPTLTNLHPETAPRYVVTAFVCVVVAIIGWATFTVAGIVWIVERFTT